MIIINNTYLLIGLLLVDMIERFYCQTLPDNPFERSTLLKSDIDRDARARITFAMINYNYCNSELKSLNCILLALQWNSVQPKPENTLQLNVSL